jgi:hypothetical protein
MSITYPDSLQQLRPIQVVQNMTVRSEKLDTQIGQVNINEFKFILQCMSIDTSTCVRIYHIEHQYINL